MDFTFNEEQEMLRESARRFVEKEWSTNYIERFVDGDRNFEEDMWQKIAEMGWTAVLIPEEYGGLGLNFVDLAVILEETGKGPMQGPFISSVVLAGEALCLAGNDEQKNLYLPEMAMGEQKGTLAWAEPGDLNVLQSKGLTAKKVGDNFVLNGKKAFVPDADQAQFIVCVAETQDGPSLFLVDKTDADLEINLLPTMDRTMKLYEVLFKDISVSKDYLLGESGKADDILRQIINRINVAYAMDMLGGGQKVLEIGVEYAKTRVQFGQVIGSFQAIKHKCAELLLAVECSRSAAYYAAWAQQQDLQEASISASIAKVFSSEMYRNATKEVLQILGGTGFSWEHQLHIFLKRAKCLGVLFGDITFHRERLAQELGY